MTGDATSDRTSVEHATRTARRSTRRRTSRMPAWLANLPVPARAGVIVVAALLVLVAGGAALDVILSAGRVHPGVSVGTLSVGGMTEAEAREAIQSYVSAQAASPVYIEAEGSTWEITSDAVALSVDATGLAESAYSVGRGRASVALAGRLRAIFGGVTVPLHLTCDEAAFSALVDVVNETVATPPVDAAVAVEGVTVTRTEPQDGFGVIAEDARERVLGAFLLSDRTVALGLGPIPPEVDAEGADLAYESAKKMVSGPVVLYYAERSWEVDPVAIGGWIGFRRVEGADPPAIEAYVTSEGVAATVMPMVAEVGRPARDASFKVSSGTVSIVPAEDGLQADAEGLAVRLTTVLTSDAERRAELTMHRVEPDITTEDAQAMGIVERLSTFTTEYSSANKPRVNNIHTLADALDGTLVPPGGTFSFNETIGPRTAEKGYQEANAIVNGKFVPQLGGGICQIGSTIFNTVFFSGLPVVERRNHSQYISSYPTGRDATVSWGGPDFKFKNDTPNWVLVATGYTNSSVTVSLYGTKTGYEVTYETGPWTNTIDPPVREIPDPTLPAGSRIVEEKGVSGRTCVVVRNVRQNGVLIRTDTFKSVYRAVEEVVRVGTAAAVPSSPATTTP